MTTGWTRVVLSNREVQEQRHMSILKLFGKLWTASGGPPDAAMFTRLDGSGESFAEIFFSPGASAVAPDLLRESKAQPCDAPEIGTGPFALALSVGRQNAFRLLTPSCAACGHAFDDHLPPEDMNAAFVLTGPIGPKAARAVPGHCDVDGCMCAGGPAALPKP